jgi:hypothetical protein
MASTQPLAAVALPSSLPAAQVLCCFAQSVASTRWMIQDEMHIQNTQASARACRRAGPPRLRTRLATLLNTPQNAAHTTRLAPVR